MNDHEHPAELLDQYWAALRKDPTARKPTGLDERIATLTAELQHDMAAPEPDAAFADELRRRLDSHAIELERTQRRGRTVGRTWKPALVPIPRLGWQLAGLAAAALILVGLLTIGPWLSKPQAVSASVVLEKAHAASVELAASGVHSFALTEVTTTSGRNRLAPQGGETRSEQRVWYQAPNELRIEQRYTELPGQPPEDEPRVMVSDGQTTWSYEPAQKFAEDSSGQLDATGLGGSGAGAMAPFGGEDLAQVLDSARTCGQPKVRGEERIAGRTTWVVDLGPNRCPGASAGSTNGSETVWIDKDSYFVLKRVARSDDGTIVLSAEVMHIEYNHDLPSDTFTFSPPPGAQVQDNRPKPAPSDSEFQQQMARIAAEADFPVFVPSSPPDGLVPRAPRTNEGPKPVVELEYVPPGEADIDSPAQSQGLSISETLANEEGLRQIAQQAQSAKVQHGLAWVRPGTTDADGTGLSTNVFLLRDGTLITIGSMRFSAADLLEVADSLQPVPGGHAPLTNPPAPDGASLPMPVPTPAFEILRPSWLPEKLTVRQQYVTQPVCAGIGGLLDFDPRQGDSPHVFLTLEEMPGGPARLRDPQATVEQIGEREVTIVRRG